MNDSVGSGEEGRVMRDLASGRGSLDIEGCTRRRTAHQLCKLHECKLSKCSEMYETIDGIA
ncbi:hypothetical protein NECAME_07148 [Necator americanus]|uniref:Uncharacterized protein n=1 Tax=Necator americanus TaxID=51031 RepID=W2TRW4_NECAM|nr:hypothetical protein NECAME_07148 [Necator americanus]ETN83856.1 hypothetical protein NECAME_07148 [Necator americanus]